MQETSKQAHRGINAVGWSIRWWSCVCPLVQGMHHHQDQQWAATRGPTAGTNGRLLACQALGSDTGLHIIHIIRRDEPRQGCRGIESSRPAGFPKFCVWTCPAESVGGQNLTLQIDCAHLSAILWLTASLAMSRNVSGASARRVRRGDTGLSHVVA